ncbi:MAG: response regulator transcription factor [Flavisolibacter sp.]|nr:response regulator transcription factor [Flavisolibacter sp.]
MATIVLVDDHKITCDGTAKFLEERGHKVLFTANNGIEFIEKLKPDLLPDIVVTDINMQQMDGYEMALWLKQNHPKVKVLALLMYEDEIAIIRMLRNGARGYYLKGNGFDDLQKAISALETQEYHLSDLVTGQIIYKALNSNDANIISQLNEKEIQFLKLCCTEMTYKEIADVMHVSPRTVDDYRDKLFEKLNVKNRVGLVLFAIKNGIVKM